MVGVLEKEVEDRVHGFSKARNLDFIFVDNGELLMADGFRLGSNLVSI